MIVLWECERCGLRGYGERRTHEFRCRRVVEMADAGGPAEYVRKRLRVGADGGGRRG